MLNFILVIMLHIDALVSYLPLTSHLKKKFKLNRRFRFIQLLYLYLSILFFTNEIS